MRSGECTRLQCRALLVAGVLVAVTLTAGVAAGQTQRRVTERFSYVTTYQGTYSFAGSWKQVDPVDSSLDTAGKTVSLYMWRVVVADVFTPTSNGEYHEVITRYTTADGGSSDTMTGGGEPSTTIDCAVEPAGGQADGVVLTQLSGTYSDAVPLKNNPTLPFSWAIPLPPQVTVEGDHCTQSTNGNSFLPDIPGGADLDYYPGLPTSKKAVAQFGQAFVGSSSVKGRYLLKHGFNVTKRIDIVDTASGTPQEHMTAKDSLSLHATVQFGRTVAKRLTLSGWKSDGGKVGKLLAEDVEQIAGLGSAVLPNESVLLPGTGPGTVQADVSSSIVPSGQLEVDESSAAGLASANETMIASLDGSTSTDVVMPVAMKLTPEGLELLRNPHPRLRLAISYRLTSPEAKEPFAASVTAIVPALK